VLYERIANLENLASLRQLFALAICNAIGCCVPQQHLWE
jgi:hypothetical protein